MAGQAKCPKCAGTGWHEVTKGGVVAVERCECVEQDRKESLAGRSAIPARFEAAGFDNFIPPSDNPRAAQVLTDAMIDASGYAREFPLTPKPGLLFQGPSGVGKTHLAVAVLRELVGRGFECMFFDYQNLLDKIRAGYNPAAGASERAAYQAALDTEVLLLDDLGSHRVTEWVEDTVTAIINHRYNNKKALIVTTNLPDEALGDRKREAPTSTSNYRVRDMLAERIGSRAHSRLFEMCKVVRIEAHDYRFKDLNRRR